MVCLIQNVENLIEVFSEIYILAFFVYFNISQMSHFSSNIKLNSVPQIHVSIHIMRN